MLMVFCGKKDRCNNQEIYFIYLSLVKLATHSLELAEQRRIIECLMSYEIQLQPGKNKTALHNLKHCPGICY